MNDLTSDGLVFTLEKRIPVEIAEIIQKTDIRTILNLPFRLAVLAPADYSPKDLEIFKGPARFRVGRARNFMLISPEFQGLNFDIIWSPLMARVTGEPGMKKPGKNEHMVFNLVLADENGMTCGIRSSLITPDVALAIWCAKTELLDMTIRAEDIQSEIVDLFNLYPCHIPELFFHASCDLKNDCFPNSLAFV